MPLFGKRDEAENRFKEAERYSHPTKKEFDLDTAIRLLEEAVMLKPDKEQYREKLDEIREIKAKRNLKFSMQVQNRRLVTFADGEAGVEVSGIVEQGTIRDGDEVEIKGRGGTRRAKVFEVVSRRGSGVAVTGQDVRLAIVTKEKVRDGDIIVGVGTGTAG